jgi:hypothetical protein
MSKIYKLGKTSITKKKEKWEIHISNNVLKQSANNLLEQEKVSTHIAGEILTIVTTNLKTLPEYLIYKNKLVEYDNACKLTSDLVYLETMLEKADMCICYYDFSDIVVVNESVFLFLNDMKVLNIDDDETISITFPIKETEPFIYPEIRRAKTLPIIVNYKASYYSLGLLVLKILLPEKKDMIILNEKIQEVLYPTRLYWFLMSVLKIEPEERKLIML